MTRSAPLDVLRGIAITVVLGRHAFRLTPVVEATASPVLLGWQRVGWSGVDLFFVLSGFLIGQLLVRELLATGHIRVDRFLARRAFRIYPAFYAMLGLTLLLLGPYAHFKASAVLAEALFVQDYVPASSRIWSHTWSLAVEEQFYLLLPLLLLLIASRPSRWAVADRLLLWLLGLGAAALGARVVTDMTGSFSDQRAVYPAHLRVDSLFAGVALAVVYVARHAEFAAFVRRHRWRLLVLAGVALSPIGLWRLRTAVVHTLGFTSVALGCCCLVAVATETAGIPSMLRPIASLGRASYSIYLFHVPVLALVEGVFRRGAAAAWPGVAVYVGGSLAVGAVAYLVIERPGLALRNMLLPAMAAVRTAGSKPA
jgi:peptidoglycan/LPS O-acetylase OafA/YrhL